MAAILQRVGDKGLRITGLKGPGVGFDGVDGESRGMLSVHTLTSWNRKFESILQFNSRYLLKIPRKRPPNNILIGLSL
jgi:hypothetical protein